MRKIKLLTALSLSAIIAFTACSKDDGAVPKNIGIEDVPVITTNTSTGTTTGTITFGNQAAFAGAFKVAMFFSDALPPTNVDVVVRKNGSTATVKLFKADNKTLPANFTITAAQIVALFGDTLKLNDTYDFAPDIYVGAKKYEAFPATGVGNGQGVTGMSALGFGEYVRYSVKP